MPLRSSWLGLGYKMTDISMTTRLNIGHLFPELVYGYSDSFPYRAEFDSLNHEFQKLLRSDVSSNFLAKYDERCVVLDKINQLVSKYIDNQFKALPVYQWLIDQGVTDYFLDYDHDSYYSTSEIYIVISDPNQAMLFKLTWVGV